MYKRWVELYSIEISMMYKGPKQKYFDIPPIPFHNYYPMNSQLEDKSEILVALKHKYSLKYVVYPILEANSSTPSNLLIRLKQNR